MSKANMQDSFLNQLRKDGEQVSLYLTSGFLIKGKVRSFDQFTVLINGAGDKQHLVYKHAIASIGVGTDQPTRIEDQ